MRVRYGDTTFLENRFNDSLPPAIRRSECLLNVSLAQGQPQRKNFVYKIVRTVVIRRPIAVVICPRKLLFLVFKIAIYFTQNKKWRPTITVAGVRRPPPACSYATWRVVYDWQ